MRRAFLSCCAVGAACVFTLVPGASLAQDEGDDLADEFDFLEDAGTVELASRHKQAIGLSPSAITVITRDDIEASGATTVPDLLRLVPGMDVIIGSPSFTAITSRLFWTNENNHYLVLIDGRETTVELLGQVPWQAQPVSIEDIERIEIIRGPASSLYGASAMAGVVSITTRAVPERTSVFSRLAGGEIGMQEGEVRGSTRLGGWGFSLAAGGELADSFSDPRLEAKRVWKLRAVAEYRWSETRRLLADFGMSDGRGNVTTSVGAIDMTFRLRTLRISYTSEDLRGHFAWSWVPTEFSLKAPLEFQGVRLAEFVPISSNSHTMDAEVQYTLPTLWEPLLVIVGGGGRASWVGSDQMLDGSTFADITSPRYHQPGLDHWEGRGGAFAHAELAPTDWMTVVGSVRLDANSETDAFFSPRLAAVFQPGEGHFVRASGARAFRKPAFVETRMHPLVSFPEDSPVTGSGRDRFLEFMARAVGNPDIDNEELWSFEAGYLGKFLDGRITVALDFYLNHLDNLIEVATRIVPGEQGLPDLDASILSTQPTGESLDFLGGELSVRYSPSERLHLTASWSHRETYDRTRGVFMDENPRDLITLGGRFSLEPGLIGSLYVFTRSEFTDYNVENPQSLMAARMIKRMPNVALILARLGWRWVLPSGLQLEAGGKLFLPVSPFEAPYFRYHEEGGGVDFAGRNFGGEQLRRMLTFYLQGSY